MVWKEKRGGRVTVESRRSSGCGWDYCRHRKKGRRPRDHRQRTQKCRHRRIRNLQGYWIAAAVAVPEEGQQRGSAKFASLSVKEM